MACYHPAKRFLTGYLTDTGKKEGVISMSNDDTPFFPLEKAENIVGHKIERNKDYVVYAKGRNGLALYNYEEIPCGHCLGCRLAKAKDWATRIEMETAMNPNDNWFLTITYNEANFPKSLSKRDMQLFIKKMRKEDKLRYFLAGEYGPKTARPHYHMILLNHNIGETKKWNAKLFKCTDLEKIWGKGNIMGAPAEPSAIAYTTQYTVKKAYELEKDWPEGIERPFILMSRRPGLGASYLENKEIKDGNIYIRGTKKQPRYVKNKLEKMNPELLEKLKEEGKKLALQYERQDRHLFNENRKTLISDKKEEIKKGKLKERRDKL